MGWFTIVRERRLTRLLERVGELEERVKALEYDIKTAVDKVQHWMWRAAKRAEADDLQGASTASSPSGPIRLTGKQARINEEILRQRAALLPKLPTEE